VLINYNRKVFIEVPLYVSSMELRKIKDVKK